MSWLGVIGNVSVDTATYPDGASYRLVGGAALYVALAASVYRPAAPIAIVGDDLAWLPTDERLAALDLAALSVTNGASCVFDLRYDAAGRLAGVDCEYGVAVELTEHALSEIGRHERYHVCCRRPLDVRRVLEHLSGHCVTLDFYLSSAADLLAAAQPFLQNASTIFVNATEAELLARVVSLDQLPAVVVSDAEREVRLLHYGEVAARVEPSHVHAVEVTGAGDTLAGAFLAHQATGCDDHEALERAVVAAAASVQHPGVTLPALG